MSQPQSFLPKFIQGVGTAAALGGPFLLFFSLWAFRPEVMTAELAWAIIALLGGLIMVPVIWRAWKPQSDPFAMFTWIGRAVCSYLWAVGLLSAWLLAAGGAALLDRPFDKWTLFIPPLALTLALLFSGYTGLGQLPCKNSTGNTAQAK